MSFTVRSPRTHAPVRRLLRRSAALGVALTLLFPALGQAPSQASNDSGQLEQTRRDLAAIQKKLAESKGQAAQIRSQVAALDRQINALDRQVGVDTRAVPDLEASIRTDQSKIQQLQAPYQEGHHAAQHPPNSNYKG